MIIRSNRKQGSQDEEMPDWSDAKQDDEDDWHIASYEETEVRLRHDLKQKNVHAVDVVSIGTKSDPIPMKDLDDEKFMTGFEDEGVYCGQNPIISALKKDTFKVKLEGRQIETSRWAMCKARQELRNELAIEESEKDAHFYKKHCAATITSGIKKIIPSQALRTLEEYEPVMGVRI